METLAYLHAAQTHENPASTQLVSILPQKAGFSGGLKWERLSSWGWKYMLPLALNLAILSVTSNVLAIERGDQGPAVTTLQQQLKASGFFNASPTDIYGPVTEDAVRRFQAANNLSVDGIAGPETLQKLEGYRRLGESKPNSPRSERTSLDDRSSGNTLKRGDSGDAVRILQEQLSAARFFNANPTGTFGPVTEDAVQRFQAAKHLVADGIVGPATRHELERFGTGGEAPPIDASRKATLRRGDSGDDVRVLQEQLATAAYFSGPATGTFGLATEDAVRRFQSAHFLAASGIAGPTTRSALNNFISHNGSHGGNATASSHLTNPDRDTLHLGDRGDDVRVLQEQLRAAGLFNTDPTGNFGPVTEDGVRRFQADNFLAASGIAGPTTRRKLQLGRAPVTQSRPQLSSPAPVTQSELQPRPSSTSQTGVVELQRRLQNLGFYDGPVNGIFDARTKAAVRGAQRYYGVSDGAIQSGRF